MRLHRADKAFEWNLNTLIQLVTLAGVLVTGGVAWNNTRRDIIEVKSWISDHEAEGRDRRAQNEAGIARLGTSVSGLDDRLDTQEAQSTRLSDRISAAEARGAEFAQTLRELQASINEQGTDLKVILSWIDEQRRQDDAAMRRQGDTEMQKEFGR